ncbi:MAG: hypothetical protein ACI808_003333 [Paraglaciecola sp.]|jgi:hypothetical protein
MKTHYRSYRLKEHGHFIVSQAGQVILFAGEGPWNEDALCRWEREMGDMICSIDKTKPWAQLSLLYGDSLMIPSAFERFITGTIERKSLGLSALGIVIKDSEITSLIKNQLVEVYKQAEIEYAFFERIEEALLWLRNQNFEISEEDIHLFLSTSNFSR